jgi:hypothetical protein
LALSNSCLLRLLLRMQWWLQRHERKVVLSLSAAICVCRASLCSTYTDAKQPLLAADAAAFLSQQSLKHNARRNDFETLASSLLSHTTPPSRAS